MAAEDAYAPDGSPIVLYATLPALGEPELIHEAVPAGSEILELGAGAGRITRGLLALGHRVVAVDQSAAMLDGIEDADTVLADIETLSLGRRFPVVVLASNFVNDPDRARVRALLGSCARHVLPGGQVLLQGFPRDWRPSSEWFEEGRVRGRLRTSTLDGRLLRGEMEYVVEGRSAFHAFESLLVAEAELEQDLAAAGLRTRRVLDERGAWIEAVAVAT